MFIKSALHDNKKLNNAQLNGLKVDGFESLDDTKKFIYNSKFAPHIVPDKKSKTNAKACFIHREIRLAKKI
jgi:hypothetical protein